MWTISGRKQALAPRRCAYPHHKLVTEADKRLISVGPHLSEPYPLEKFEAPRPHWRQLAWLSRRTAVKCTPTRWLLQNSMRQHNTNSGQKVASPASMKTLTLRMVHERRAVIVKSLRAYLRQV